MPCACGKWPPKIFLWYFWLDYHIAWHDTVALNTHTQNQETLTKLVWTSTDQVMHCVQWPHKIKACICGISDWVMIWHDLPLWIQSEPGNITKLEHSSVVQFWCVLLNTNQLVERTFKWLLLWPWIVAEVLKLRIQQAWCSCNIVASNCYCRSNPRGSWSCIRTYARACAHIPVISLFIWNHQLSSWRHEDFCRCDCYHNYKMQLQLLPNHIFK